MRYISTKSGEETIKKHPDWIAKSKNKIMWKSGNENAVTVNTNGLLTAKGKGSDTITVSTANNRVATCNVTVAVNVTSIELNNAVIFLKYKCNKNVTQREPLIYKD